MDQWLAQVYGTGVSEEEQLEKVAQAAFVEKLAEEEGIDISEFSPEEIEAIAQEVLAVANSGSEEEAEEEEEELPPADEDDETEGLAKEAQAKFEEADFLGRVMAHAYTQELEKIGMPSASQAHQAVKNWGQAAKYLGKKHGRAVAGATIGAAGGYAAGRIRTKDKKASAFDVLVEQRAIELLEEAGFETEE